MTRGDISLKLATEFTIVSLLSTLPEDLRDAIHDTESRLKTDKFQRLVVGRGVTDAASVQNAAQLHVLELSLAPHAHPARSISAEATSSIALRSEAYELSIPHDGSSARLSANSTLGLFRGLTTFSQLWYTYGSSKYFLDAPIHIKDSPAFVSKFFSL
jgi:hexosaminidase